MDLRCRKTECLFNDKFVCRANGININESCECKTYQSSSKIEPDTSRNILRTTPIYSRYRECQCLDINCKAKCHFNHSGECEANGITLNVLNECPYCITFLKK